MNGKVCRWICLFCATIFAGVSAHAADFTFFIGAEKPGKLSTPVVVDALTSYDQLETSTIFGFRLSTNFVPMFGLEHTLAFSRDFLHPKGNPGFDFPDTHGFIYSSNLILNFPATHFVPYATAGVGLIHQSGASNLPVGTKLAFNYGGGLKLPRMLGPLGLRFDVRGYSTTFGRHENILEISGGALISF